MCGPGAVGPKEKRVQFVGGGMFFVVFIQILLGSYTSVSGVVVSLFVGACCGGLVSRCPLLLSSSVVLPSFPSLIPLLYTLIPVNIER